jgi:hypothetical protein
MVRMKKGSSRQQRILLILLSIILLGCLASLLKPFLDALNYDPALPYDVLWERTFGGPQDENGCFVSSTGDGGFLLAGSKKDSLNGSMGILLVKIDKAGEPIWEKEITGAVSRSCRSLTRAQDGSHVLCGAMKSGGGSSESGCYMMKVDGAGKSLWEIPIAAEEAAEVRSTRDGGFCVVGDSGSMAYLLRTDSGGRELWSQTFGQAQTHGASVDQTADDGFIVAGDLRDRPYLARTDSMGKLLWERSYGEQKDGALWAVRQTTDGGFIGTGKITMKDVQRLLPLKTGPSGDPVWQQTPQIGDSCAGHEIIEVLDRTLFGLHVSYVISGCAFDYDDDRGLDALVVKADSLGNIVWHRKYGNADLDEAFGIVRTENGEILVGGQTWRTSAQGRQFDWQVVKLGPASERP